MKINLLSLPFKINTAIFTTAIVIGSLFVAILYPLELERREDQVKRINLLMDTVLQQKINDLANELFAGQKRALFATLKEIEAVDGIIGVRIFTGDRNHFLSSNGNLDPVPVVPLLEKTGRQPVFETVQLMDRNLAVYANAIEVIGEKIGYIAIYYDLAKLERESRKAMTIIFMLPIATVLLMAVLLNLFLFRSIIRPVSLLRNAMRRVEAGLLGQTVSLPGRDEIVDMGAAFNDMSLKLRKGHEALIEAEEKYRSIFENAIEGIFQYAPDQERFITVNPAMAAILGYASPEEAIETIREIEQQFFAHRDDWLAFSERLRNLGRITGFESELCTKAGGRIWALISARQVAADGGRPLYHEGSFVDITEQKQIEAAERQREAAESASRAKSRFLANMSHEIRTPLNAILGFADILDSSLSDHTQRKYIRIIQSSGANLLDLINDILDLSKIEAGRMEIKPVAVSIHALTREMRALFSVHAREKHIRLLNSVAPEVPEFVMLDRTRLRQVLFNLIGNAVKFTEEGRVEITTRVLQSDRDRCNLAISVRDTGPGIEPDALRLIFESFHQYGGTPSRAGEGTGLGLAISKYLVEMMNGEIRVKSSPGRGSQFTIHLPDVPVSTGMAESMDTAEGAAPLIDPVRTPLWFDPARLLIVDDLEVNRQLISAALKDTGLAILETDNGRSAVEMAVRYRPDLILMDIKMPVMDGYETISRIRRKQDREIPIIAITAAGMKEDISNIREAGFDDYLIRPFNKANLLEKIGRFLSCNIRTSSTGPKTARDTDSPGEGPAGDKNRPWTCPGPVAKRLQGDYTEEWKEICRRQSIPEIEAFSGRLGRLGREHGLKALVAYSRTLTGYAEAIDIDNLQRSLARFPELLGQMNKTA